MVSKKFLPYGKGSPVMSYAFFMSVHFLIDTAEVVQTGGNFETFRSVLPLPESFRFEVQFFGSVEVAGQIFPEGKGKKRRRHARIIRGKMTL